MSPTVLYIDDDESNRRLLTRLISRHRPDYMVCTAGTGREGVEAARRETPDVVLLDVNLPDMPGQRVLETLRSRTSVSVIMVTGDVGEDRAAKLFKAGAVAYVTKPFDIDHLVRLIDEVIGVAPEESQA